MNRNSISTDEELRQGDYLLSENGNYKAIFQVRKQLIFSLSRPVDYYMVQSQVFAHIKELPVLCKHRDVLRLSNWTLFLLLPQHDGNFVIYTWRPTWASDTCGKNPFRIVLQQDTNLVMYTKEDHPVWASGTFSNQHTTRMRLTLTNEGQLVLDNNGKKIWSAGEK